MPLNSFVFNYSEDQHGNCGWILKPEFDVSTPRAIAHDIIEHFSDDNGSVEHELMALGSILYGRYQMGLVSGDGLSSDICYLFMNFILNNKMITNIKYKQGLKNETLSERELDNILFDATDYIKKELNNYEEILTSNILKQITDYLTIAKKWIIKGYFRAKRKYKDPYIITELFNEIERKAERCQHGDYGMQLKVTYQIQPEIKVWTKESFILN